MYIYNKVTLVLALPLAYSQKYDCKYEFVQFNFLEYGNHLSVSLNQVID